MRRPVVQKKVVMAVAHHRSQGSRRPAAPTRRRQGPQASPGAGPDRLGPTLGELHHEPREGFRHEALFYGSEKDFLEATGAFVEAGLSGGEPVMVALVADKVEALRRWLGADSEGVVFADMAELGRNPARIIPAWRRFLDGHSDSPVLRGIGEPVWADRPADELAECQRHEVLLNLAFAGDRPWRLMCPYDTASLGEDVLREARRSHPHVLESGRMRPSPLYGHAPAVFSGGLPEPPEVAGEQRFDAQSLRYLRMVVSPWASSVLPTAQAAALVLAAHEVAANSVRHGGGGGVLRYWSDAAGAVIEVTDTGRLQDPLLGRTAPFGGAETGRGLWLANQLCDLVQIRSSETGTVVRLRVAP